MRATIRISFAWCLAVASLCGAAASARTVPEPDPLAGDSAIVIWNEAALEAIREGGVPAPIASRDLAIVDTSMYDAWAAYDARALGTDGTSRLRRPPSERTLANASRAESIAAFYALRDVIAVTVADVTLAQTGQTIGRGDRAERVGRAAAKAVLAARHADGSNQLGDRHVGAYADYTAYRATNRPLRVVDPSRWEPLLVYDGLGRFIRQRFLVPQWGDVRPFAISPDAAITLVPPPAAFSTAAYVDQARDILDTSARLTDREKVIAEYWADGMMTDSPPGHWLRFAIFVSKRDRYDNARDAKLFFTLSNAMLDAGIACWRVKRSYDSERPVTAIRALFAGRTVRAWAGPGRGVRTIDGASWKPYQPAEVVTPAFPEHVSGHSTFSAAAAEVLRRYTGSDRFGATFVEPRGRSIVEPGIVPAADVRLTWPTFTAAANEAGQSRRFGGIHFRAGDFCGRRLGRYVGATVFVKATALANGIATSEAPPPQTDARASDDCGPLVRIAEREREREHERERER